ncbi:hypothetical protein PFISCL1PPCAC_20235, partial [Pristionchus fissidentatus]
ERESRNKTGQSTPFTMLWLVVVSLLLHCLDAAVSPPQTIVPSSAKSSHAHPLIIPDHKLTLWCTADGIKSAKLVHLSDKKTHVAKVTGNNASITFDAPTVLHAGDYRCEMDTKTGLKTETTSVYVRPIVHTEHSEKVDTKKDEFNLELSNLVVTEGETVNVTCPVFAHPLPKVKWNKDNKAIKLSSRVSLTGDRLTIHGVDYSDEGVYSCEAVNEFTVASKTTRPLLTVARSIMVKSQYAWIWPLAVIIATLITLVVIIWACEIRKNKKEKRTNTYVE